jgi:hypothetical protein
LFPALRAESLCFFLVQPCPRSLQRLTDFLSSQNAFFLSASRGVFPNAGLSHHVSLLKTIFLYFSPALRAVYVFSPDASFLTNKMALRGLPHKQICSTWSSPRRELLYQGFPANRSCLPELPHEQNYFTWVSPQTELSVANLFVEVILFVGKPK